MISMFLLMFLALGGILIGLSIPLIKRRVPPNPWYGFRVRRTLRDPDVWYPANEYAAWRLLWVGIAIWVVAVAAYFIPDVELSVYSTIVAAAAAIGLAISVVQSFAFLGTLNGDHSNKPTD